ncbi:MAG: malto-oligosyltrehalose trehalohydrolase [Acidobacteria bacterium RIFCSPLOWO2_02_FULL_59_13]|nr:MAG: malto-oligosyltrehalose trehalohydrolase [Acidobacteria bacterium RIFCSPLOWO2_02_FULL_59_13]
MAWQPSLGAWPIGTAIRFRVWAPHADRIEVVVEQPVSGQKEFALEKSPDGFFCGTVADAGAGWLYRYRVDGQGPYPDPASRFQPLGVHGPSQVVDPHQFVWSDDGWTGVAQDELVLYELHVGTFTPGGTFAAAAEKLPELRQLGITAVELMPVADFAGNHNWGYDGVALFAPARCYGTPDDLRRLVDAAHRTGLAVHLDVVYNHFGPDGAYAGLFSPYYFSSRHKSPWGDGINFDGDESALVRSFFIENALHWIHEYHFDGLRLDATHAIVDDSPRHFLAELSAAVQDSPRGARLALVIAEDVRNLAHMVQPHSEQGWGVDAVWSDDFHHQVRRCLAGDRDGYFQDFEGTPRDIALTAKQGWFYSGQYAPFFGQQRGTDPAGLPPSRFVFFIQNHDQVGNRAFGERLHHQIELSAYRAATALLLLLPQIPLLFMGQEWAASSPFRFFTDHSTELGKLVTEGRRNEFSRFAAFADPQTRQRIPDPQDRTTFQASRLNWEEREQQPHAAMLRFYKRLLELRKTEPALLTHSRESFAISPWDESGLLLRRNAVSGSALLAVFRLQGAGTYDLRPNVLSEAGDGNSWDLLLTSEENLFTPDPLPPQVELSGPLIRFFRPGAVLFKAREARNGRSR